MKADIHPAYHPVVFLDTSTGHKFFTRTTMNSKEKIKWEDGKEYPLITVDISSASHPFYTGKMKYVDSAGRVEKFQKKYKWGRRDASSRRIRVRLACMVSIECRVRRLRGSRCYRGKGTVLSRVSAAPGHGAPISTETCDNSAPHPIALDPASRPVNNSAADAMRSPLRTHPDLRNSGALASLPKYSRHSDDRTVNNDRRVNVSQS
jgi:large subunit ribosomal protein L31